MSENFDLSSLKPVYVYQDKQFSTKAELQAYVRRPKVLAELMKLTSNNETLSNWLIENQESVEVAFEAGSIRRVTKAESARLEKDLAYLKATHGEDKNLAFLVTNAGAILESFRWPSVRRMTEEEKVNTAMRSLTAMSGNEDTAKWIVANRDAVLQAFQAGVEKRQINDKAKEALEAYRARKAAEKAAAEANASQATTQTDAGQTSDSQSNA